MENWLESVYSDGTERFVSNSQPNLGEVVTIRIRMYEDAPVKHVLIRVLLNGAERLKEMRPVEVKNGLVYYEAMLKISEPRIQYQFYLACDNIIYYYNQREITTYIPDHTYDFVLLTEYKQPKWVKESVFYQIFPERFYNGNTKNDVKNGEYSFNGHSTTKMNHWTDKPLTYEEGFCLDFYGGDLEGIKEKIPYLKELGVNALYLNPIFSAPSMHKYDCIDYFHVDKHFGGDEALKQLVDELHKNGMKIILDISINHTGTAHKWFNKDGEFYDKKYGAYNNPESKERKYYFFEEKSNDYATWLGTPTLPTLNYTSEELKDVIYRKEDSVLKKWLKEPYCIDGWRFDVADVFARKDELQLSHEIWPEIQKSIREENEEAYILAEDWGDCAIYLQGMEWDSPMNYFGCARVLRQFVGLPELFLERNEILRKIPYKMTAEDAKERIMEHLAKLPYVISENQFNLLDSHDVPRMYNYQNLNKEEYRGAVMIQFALIGTPSIYYGDEVALDGIVETNEGCRYPMRWDEDAFDCENFKLYQTLAHKKLESVALKKGGMKFLYAANQVLAIARFYQDEVIVALMSTNDEEVIIDLQLGVLGVSKIKHDRDIFCTPMNYERINDRYIKLVVPAHTGFFFECEK